MINGKYIVTFLDDSTKEFSILERANLYGANLEGANLYGANLEGANLRYANLEGANLEDANLEDAKLGGANLWDANLRGANLWGANLWGANLRGANLRGANLWGANLGGANLWGANLGGAKLEDAKLGGANLWGANLRGANLEDAKLGNANLDSAKGLHLFKIVPEEGGFIAYKKVKHLTKHYVLTLGIPKDAQRVNSLVGRKIRVDKCKVLKVEDETGNIITDKSLIMRGTNYVGIDYFLGAEITEKNYNGDIRIECTNGIHCFLTKQEARDWK